MFKELMIAAVLFIVFTFSTSAQQLTNLDASGVRNSSGLLRLNKKQLQMLTESLRHKSGFIELGFDQHGALTLGNRRNVAGGSATARALLVAAVDSANLYVLESHENSPEIAFAQNYAAATLVDPKTGGRKNIDQVQLDFADFNRLGGDRQAKASFDIGIALLHELTHGVLKIEDPPSGSDQIGECGAHVNKMRRELQLPERLYYYPGISVVQTPVDRLIFARLVFVERTAANAKPSKQYSLNYLPSRVSPNAQSIAELHQGLLVGRTH